jgi:23S rRNA (cytidine1920-2'-O)/16S rRNA (cytidine1409-2'-O)-methyltransferase
MVFLYADHHPGQPTSLRLYHYHVAMSQQQDQYVSRGGLKLAAALDAFQISVQDKVCADLGCSTGGFTDCLLQRGAACVYAIDTAYGQLAWKLRQNPRVTVMERTNALHAPLPEHFPGCDLVTIDLGWTRQEKAIPAALRWLSHDENARIISLVKPHYEKGLEGTQRGVLTEDQAQTVLDLLIHEIKTLGVDAQNVLPSPIRGSKGGNREWLILLQRSTSQAISDNK